MPKPLGSGFIRQRVSVDIVAYNTWYREKTHSQSLFTVMDNFYQVDYPAAHPNDPEKIVCVPVVTDTGRGTNMPVQFVTGYLEEKIQ